MTKIARGRQGKLHNTQIYCGLFLTETIFVELKFSDGHNFRSYYSCDNGRAVSAKIVQFRILTDNSAKIRLSVSCMMMELLLKLFSKASATD